MPASCARPQPQSVFQKAAFSWSRTCWLIRRPGKDNEGGILATRLMWRLLVVHFTPRPRAVRLTTEQHLRALTDVPGVEVLDYSAVHGLPSWLRRLRFDAVALHTTLLGMRWSPWFEQWRRRLDWLSELDALKIAFPQDEYWH